MRKEILVELHPDIRADKANGIWVLTIHGYPVSFTYTKAFAVDGVTFTPTPFVAVVQDQLEKWFKTPYFRRIFLTKHQANEYIGFTTLGDL